MKKVMLLMGSPRKNGNTAFVAQRVLESMAELEELAVEYVDCSRLGNKPRGCAACYRCRPMKFRCAISDATAEVINRLADYDIVLLATPVYFFNFSAQLKSVTDRFQALVDYDEKGKLVTPLKSVRIGCIATSEGDAQSSGVEVVELSLKYLAGYAGLKKIPMLHQVTGGADLTVVEQDRTLDRRAMAFAKKLVK